MTRNTAIDAGDPSLPYNGPFGFYYLDAETLELMYWSGPYGMYYYDGPDKDPGKSITGSSSAELYGADDE